MGFQNQREIDLELRVRALEDAMLQVKPDFKLRAGRPDIPSPPDRGRTQTNRAKP